MAKFPDYYAILQVSPDAEPEVIEAAYRRLARKYHPDVNTNAYATAKMKELNAAYALLSDPQKRRAYDALKKQTNGHSTEEQVRSDADISVKVGNKNAWWRWIILPPGAIGAFVGIQLAGRLLMGLWSYPSDDKLTVVSDGRETSLVGLLIAFAYPYLSTALRDVGGSWAFVAVGARIAPSRHFVVGLILTLLMTVMLTGGLNILSQGRFSFSQTEGAPVWWLVVTHLLGIVAMAATVLGLRKTSD